MLWTGLLLFASLMAAVFGGLWWLRVMLRQAMARMPDEEPETEPVAEDPEPEPPAVELPTRSLVHAVAFAGLPPLNTIRQAHHHTDTYYGERQFSRKISNWENTYDAATHLWMPSTPDVEDSEEVVDGEAMRWADRRNPLRSFLGDGSTAQKTGLITLADAARPDRWAKLKLLNVNAVAPIVTRGERLTVFPGIVDYTTLVTQRGRGRFHKHLRLAQPGHPAEFRWMVIQPAGHTWAIVDNSLRLYDATGAEWLKTVPAGGRDSSPGEFGKSIRVAMVQRAAIGNYGTFACRPNAVDLAAAVYPVEIDDPTATLGVGAMEDAWIWSFNENNNGGNGAQRTGRSAADSYTERTLLRLATSSIPAGTYSAFRYCMYRIASDESVNAGTLDAYIVASARNWVEGTANGAVQTGSVSWTYTQHNTASWGSAGCSAATDRDDDATPPTMAYASYVDGAPALHTFSGLKTAWLDAWKQGTRTNNGMLLRTRTESAGTILVWYGSEAGVNDPYIEIDYTAASGVAAAAHYYRMTRRR